MSSFPLVSVLIPTWNTADFLPEALQSALDQTWPNIEIIVIDDGSTDNTEKVVAPYLSRIRYQKRPHMGLTAARNAAIALAKGDFIAPLDADDVWLPSKIQVQMMVAVASPNSGLIVCNVEEFEGSRLLQPSMFAELGPAIQSAREGGLTRDFYPDFIKKNRITCPAQTLIPRHVVEAIGPFRNTVAEDYEYYLRIARDYQVTFHTEVLARYRYRAESLSGPGSGRMVRWAYWDVLILLAERARCRGDARATLEETLIDKLRFLDWELRNNAGFESLKQSQELMRLLLRNPWPLQPLMQAAACYLGVRFNRVAKYLSFIQRFRRSSIR